MRTLPLLLVTLAACGGGSKAKPLGNFATGEPAGAPPTLTWTGGAPTDGGTFDVSGLPAVSDDGGRVLVARQVSDGGRGYPNLALITRDRTDKTVEERVVLDAEKVDGMNDPIDVTADNQYLATSHAAARWRPLTAAAVQAAGGGTDLMDASAWTSQAGEVSLRFDDAGHLVVEHGGKTVVDDVMADWLVKPYPMYEGAGTDEMCGNPVFLAGAFVDAHRRLAVLQVDFRGTDSCWEPGVEYHVVAW
jgi:hypothetical protein